MIAESAIPNSMAPWGEDVAYKNVMPCVILLKKQDIVTINVYKRETQPFPLHSNQTRLAIFWCCEQDKV